MLFGCQAIIFDHSNVSENESAIVVRLTNRGFLRYISKNMDITTSPNQNQQVNSNNFEIDFNIFEESNCSSAPERLFTDFKDVTYAQTSEATESFENVSIFLLSCAAGSDIIFL